MDVPWHDDLTSPLRSTSEPNSSNTDSDPQVQTVKMIINTSQLFKNAITALKGACIQGVLGRESGQLFGEVLLRNASSRCLLFADGIGQSGFREGDTCGETAHCTSLLGSCSLHLSMRSRVGRVIGNQ